MSQSNGRSKRGGYGPPAPAINLIVDPRFFAPALSGHPKLDHQRRRSTSSSLSTSNSNLDDIKRYSRASFSDVLAARAEFSLARRWLTKLLVTDILIALGWASVFGFCMTGPACPAGTSEKWSAGHSFVAAESPPLTSRTLDDRPQVRLLECFAGSRHPLVARPLRFSHLPSIGSQTSASPRYLTAHDLLASLTISHRTFPTPTYASPRRPNALTAEPLTGSTTVPDD